MMNKIGLGGILSFNSKAAEASLGRVSRAFGGLQNRAAGLKSGLAGSSRATNRMTSLTNNMGQGFMNASRASLGLAMATAPLTMALKSGAEQYIEFNRQMSAVSAVGQLNRDEFKVLRAEAMELGASTVFTATQAAQGMEELARAGFSVGETLDATNSVLSLAAADNITLAESARVTATVLRGMSLEADQAARVTDVLAFASANSNTNVLGLGEAFKMSAATSNLLGISLEETAAILGKIADSGLRGSQGGIAFNNMMNKLIRPTKKSAEFIDKYNIQLTDADGKMRKIAHVVEDVAKVFNTIPDVAEKAAIGMELTGLRGVKALNALFNALDGGDTSLSEFQANLEKSGGVAEEMAKERLNNLAGQITLFQSAMEGIVIRVGDMFKGMDGSGLKPVVDVLQNIIEVWDALSGENPPSILELNTKHGETIVSVVLGIRDGIRSIIETIDWAVDRFQKFFKNMENTFGSDQIRAFTKISVVLLGLGAILGPVIGGFALIAYIVSTAVVPAMSALGGILGAIFWPAVVAIGAVTMAFLLLRNEGESFGEFAQRMWIPIKAAALEFWKEVLEPLWESVLWGAEVVWPTLSNSIGQVFTDARGALNEFLFIWNEFSTNLGINFKLIGMIIIGTIGFLIDLALKPLAGAFRIVGDFVRELYQSIVELFSGNIKNGFKRLGEMFINLLLLPVRLVVLAINSLVSAILNIPGVTDLVSLKQMSQIKALQQQLGDFADHGVHLVDPDTGKRIVGTTAPAPDFAGRGAPEQDEDPFQKIEERRVAGHRERAKWDREQKIARVKQETKKTEISVTTNIDGKKVAQNQAKHQQDLSDRLGFNTPPFVRRVSAEQGSLPSM